MYEAENNGHRICDVFHYQSAPAQAAQELTPEQAAQYQPFERIAVTGRFNAIYEAAAAVSRKADKMGADAFYIQSLDDLNNNGNMRVVADVYHRDAPPAEEKATASSVALMNYLRKMLSAFSRLIPSLSAAFCQQS